MRWLLWGAAALVTLALVAGLALVLVPTERIARLSADRLSAATGRDVTIKGPVRATLWPRLGARAEGIAVANAPWSTEGPMLTAASVEVGVPFAALLGGDMRLESLRIDGARLVLERREDGIANWQSANLATQGEPAGPAPATAPRDVSIDRMELRDAQVIWIDRAARRQVRLRNLQLETRLDGLDAPMRATATGLLDDMAVTVEAGAAALRPLLDGALTPVTLSVAAGGTTFALDGRADLDAPSFEGRLEAASDDRFALLAPLGLAWPTLPGGLGARSVALSAAATLAPAGTIHLRDMVAELDGNGVTGAVDIDPTGARPRVDATLAADALDLTAAAGAGGGGIPTGPAASSAPGWSRAPIDVSALFAADGQVDLATGPVTFDTTRIDELRARVTIEEGRAVVALQPLLAYGGTVTGEVVVNGRGGLSSRADLTVSGLQLQPFLAAFGGYDRLVGAADLTLGLLGVGDSMQALMESLEGGVALRVGQGAVLGLDLAGMIRTLDLSYRGEGQETVFEGLSLSAAVAGGVARSDDLSLVGPYLGATGEGSADIGAQTVSYRLMPTLRAKEDDASLTVPVLIEGPWADPRIRPDLEYLARERLDLEREAVEARLREEADAARVEAEDALRERLARELEVAPEALGTREGIEDALRERVEDRLLDLLQGR